ncbi:hypothetical protein SLA2020_255800 [Shorea laevis]
MEHFLLFRYVVKTLSMLHYLSLSHTFYYWELGIQLSYLLLVLSLLGVGTFFVIRQVLERRELNLSAKELQLSQSSVTRKAYIFVKP